MSLIKDPLKGTPSNMVELLEGVNKNNSLIVEMPNSPYWFVGTINSDRTWNVDLMDPESDKKEAVHRRISKDKFKLFIYGLYGIDSNNEK